MRQIVFVLAVLAGASPAAAEGWKEYRDAAYAFAVSFPGDPKIEAASYRDADGRTFPSQVYSVAQNNAVFKVTIVDMSDPAPDESAVIDQAIKKLSAGGEIKVNIAHRVSRVFGRQLSIVEADGSRVSAAVFFHEGRLYQIEGQALATGDDATGEAIRFQQSLMFTDGTSNRPPGERERRGPPRGPRGPDSPRGPRPLPG